MKRRACQPCTACCDGWLASKIIDMSPGRPCRHRLAGGCGIYKTRPQSPCRSFQCDWVRPGSKLPAGLRPDISGAIVMSDRNFHGWNVIMATPTGWKIPRETLRLIMQYARESDTPLIYIENFHQKGVYTHFSRSGYGPKAFMEALERQHHDLAPIEIS